MNGFPSRDLTGCNLLCQCYVTVKPPSEGGLWAKSSQCSCEVYCVGASQPCQFRSGAFRCCCLTYVWCVSCAGHKVQREANPSHPL